jgi:hypothetical protein
MSSIFTKEDVIKMLNEMESKMEDTPSSDVSEDFLIDLLNSLKTIKSDIEIVGKDEVLSNISDIIIEVEDEIEKVFFKKISDGYQILLERQRI